VCLPLAYALVVLWIFPKWTVDDAYITYRYAENLALHGELTWNVGEDPVEGYTGVVLPVLLAGAISVGVDPDLASKCIGVLSFLLGVLLLYRIGVLASIRPPVIAAMLVLYLTLPMMFTHVYGVLETTLFGTILLAAIAFLLQCLKPSENSDRDEVWFLLVLLLLSLTRPEGMAFSAIATTTLFVSRWLEERRFPRSLLIRILLLLVLPMTAYISWRWLYYGSLLPNTYYAKLPIHEPGRISIIAYSPGFWHRYLALPVYSGLLVALGYLLALKKPRSEDSPLMERAVASTLIALMVFLAIVAIQYDRSLAIMRYSYRFFVPFYASLLLVIGMMANGGFKGLLMDASRWRIIRWIPLVLAATLLTAQVYRHVKYLFPEIVFAEGYQQLIRDEHKAAGLFLREHIPETEWLIVNADAGATSYFSRLKTVDYGRLNDKALARQLLTLREKVDHFFSYDPGAAIFTSVAADSVENSELITAILSDSRLDRYSLAQQYSTESHPYYHLFLYLRSDLMFAEPGNEEPLQPQH